MKIICGIYKIENLVNHKIYIGQSVDIYKRWMGHKNSLRAGTHHNEHLQNAWNKYKEYNFLFEIIEICDKDLLNEREIYYIAEFDSIQNGYNIYPGGNSRSGYIVTEETRAKMSESHKGILGTEESKAKQSAALSGKNNPMYGRRGSLSPVYGINKTHEQIQKMMDSRWTEEKRVENSMRIKGENNPMFGKYGSLNPESKAVICINTGEMFESIKIAAKWCGLKASPMIGQVCLGQRKSAGKHPITGEKLYWKYAYQIITNQCEINEIAL